MSQEAPEQPVSGSGRHRPHICPRCAGQAAVWRSSRGQAAPQPLTRVPGARGSPRRSVTVCGPGRNALPEGRLSPDCLCPSSGEATPCRWTADGQAVTPSGTHFPLTPGSPPQGHCFQLCPSRRPGPGAGLPPGTAAGRAACRAGKGEAPCHQMSLCSGGDPGSSYVAS